jgi:hypothetical protein
MDGRWQSDLAWSYILTIEIYIHALHYIGVKQKWYEWNNPFSLFGFLVLDIVLMFCVFWPRVRVLRWQQLACQSREEICRISYRILLINRPLGGLRPTVERWNRDRIGDVLRRSTSFVGFLWFWLWGRRSRAMGWQGHGCVPHTFILVRPSIPARRPGGLLMGVIASIWGVLTAGIARSRNANQLSRFQRQTLRLDLSC